MNSLLQTLAPPPVSRFTKSFFSATMELYPQKYVRHPKGDHFIMNNELKPILARVDHTLLSQTATWDQIRAICDDGVK